MTHPLGLLFKPQMFGYHFGLSISKPYQEALALSLYQMNRFILI